MEKIFLQNYNIENHYVIGIDSYVPNMADDVPDGLYYNLHSFAVLA